MAKDTFYFPHDYNARNDEKILELRANFGAEGYGIFWMIVETMAENENGGVKASLIGGLSLGYGIAKEKLSEIIDMCLKLDLFYEMDGNVFSKRLLTYKEYRKSLSISGSEGAKKRWGGHRAPNGEGNGEGNANKSKGNKIKEKIRGVRFSEDGLKVFFPDGSSQELGQGQQMRFREGNYQPHYIFQGLIE